MSSSSSPPSVTCISTGGVFTAYDLGIGSFDSAIDGIVMQAGWVQAAGGEIWGSGNALVGMKIEGPLSALAWSTIPTITGSSADVAVSGTTYSWSSITSGVTATNGARAYPNL